MRVVCVVFFFDWNAFATADQRDSPLILCAPHSALSLEQGMPQTFSVYDSKNILNSRVPKRFDTHVAKSSSGCVGKSCARKKLNPHRADSSSPSPRSAFIGSRGYAKNVFL